MAIAIKNTNDVSINGIKCVVYGESGVGKTYLLRTAPRPIILSAEAGLLSIQGSGIDYIEVHSSKDLFEAYEFLRNPENSSSYDTICLDSISEIAEIMLTEEKAKTKDGRQVYGNFNDQFISLLRAFRDIQGKNVVFVAKMDKVIQQDGATRYSVMIPGSKGGNQTPYFFDEVFALRAYRDPETKTISRALQTTGDSLYVAKDRAGVLDEFEEPNLTEIFNKIKER